MNDDRNSAMFMDTDILDPTDSNLKNCASNVGMWSPTVASFTSVVLSRLRNTIGFVIDDLLAYLA